MSDPLWNSFANVVRFGEEAEATMAALEEALGAITSLPIDVSNTVEDDILQPVLSDDEWVITAWYNTYQIKHPKRQIGPSGRVTVSISFWQPQDEIESGWPAARQAKLFVAYTPRKSAAWDFSNLWVNGAGGSSTSATSNYRWLRGAGGDTDCAWFFCVRLAEITSRAAVERELIQPLQLLLNGRSEEEAFAESTAILKPPMSRTSTSTINE